MKIRQIKESDIEMLSSMHIKALPETTSSKLGEFYLQKIYKTITRNKMNNCAFVAVEKNEILGIIAATTNLILFQTQVKRYLTINDYLKILYSIISFRITLHEILKRIQFENKLIQNYKNNYATVIILFVNKKHRKKGIGTQLLKEILNFYRKKMRYIYIDTKLTNKPAIKLYEKLEYIHEKRIEDSTLMSFYTKI